MTLAGAIRDFRPGVQPAAIGNKRKLSVRTIRPSRVHAFSDCVVQCGPQLAPTNLVQLLVVNWLISLRIQASLAQAGVFVRGGVTVDRIHSSDTVVFGPGLIRAYRLENELAHVPRIIVDPAAIQKFRERAIPKSRMQSEITAMRKSIRQADDGLWFVDYLRAGAAALGEDAAIREFLKQRRPSSYRRPQRPSTWPHRCSQNISGRRSITMPRASAFSRAVRIPGITISKTQLPEL